MSAPCCNYVMASARVVGTIGGHGPKVLIWWDLVEQFRQHGRITDVAGGDLYRANLQRFLINPDMYLAPNTSLGAVMLVGVPFPGPEQR